MAWVNERSTLLDVYGCRATKTWLIGVAVITYKFPLVKFWAILVSKIHKVTKYISNCKSRSCWTCSLSLSFSLSRCSYGLYGPCVVAKIRTFLSLWKGYCRLVLKIWTKLCIRFVYSSPFLKIMIVRVQNLTITGKSGNGVLGVQIRHGRILGIDQSTELCRPYFTAE